MVFERIIYGSGGVPVVGRDLQPPSGVPIVVIPHSSSIVVQLLESAY